MESIVEPSSSPSRLIARVIERKRWILSALVLFTISPVSVALAIDCSRAESRVDQAICADPGLLRLDAMLKQDYAAAMKRLSPAGQSALQSDQRSWLRYRAIACGFSDPNPSTSDLQCLGQQLKRRDELSLSSTVNAGPWSRYLLVRSYYETTPSASGYLPFQAESSIPQIDQIPPQSNIAWEEAKAWNTLIARHIGGPDKVSLCKGGQGDIHKDFRIDWTSSMLIGVSVVRSDQCHGIPPEVAIIEGTRDHANTTTQYNIVMMRGDVHDLTPSDLFLPGDGWKHLLTERLAQEIQRLSRSRGNEGHPSEDVMERIATNPSTWIVSEDALGIGVNEDALSIPGIIGGFTVIIPRSDLQSFLSIRGQRILNAPSW